MNDEQLKELIKWIKWSVEYVAIVIFVSCIMGGCVAGLMAHK
jgi:hypothetical protein